MQVYRFELWTLNFEFKKSVKSFTYHTFFLLLIKWFFVVHKADRLQELLENSVQYRDSRHLRHRPMIGLFHPILIIKLISKVDQWKFLQLTSLTSLMSPTSRCFASTPAPFVSAGPSVGPAPTGGHLEVIVPAPSPPSVNEKKFSIIFWFSIWILRVHWLSLQQKSSSINSNLWRTNTVMLDFIIPSPQISVNLSFILQLFPPPARKNGASEFCANGQQLKLRSLNDSLLSWFNCSLKASFFTI